MSTAIPIGRITSTRSGTVDLCAYPRTKTPRSLLGMYVVILLAVSLIPILILSAVAISSLRSQLLADVDATTRSINQAIVYETHRFVENSNDHLEIYGGLFDSGYDSTLLQTALEVTSRSHHEIERLFVLDEKSTLILATSQNNQVLGTDYSGLEFLSTSTEEGESNLFSSATLSPFSGSVTVFMGRRTEKGWTVVFELNLDSLSEYLVPLRIGSTDHIAIIDRNGRFIAHTELENVQEQRFETRLPPGPQSKTELFVGENHWYVYTQEIPETPWRAVYYRDADRALSALANVIGVVYGISLGSMALALLIAFHLRRVSHLIFAEYVQRTESVAAGRYELQVDAPFVEFNGLSRSITAMAEAVSRRETELLRAISEREHLLREIHHRVKNNLQVVISLLNLEGESLSNPEQSEALNSSVERIHSMALVHETLYGQSRLDEVDLGEYAGSLLTYISSSYGKIGISIKRNLTSVGLSLDQALPCGLILNELITNGFKYGISDRAEAILIVSVLDEAESIVLSVEDNGPGFPPNFDPTTSSSLGLFLVRSLAEQLGGTAVWNSLLPVGTLATIRFPKI